MLPPCEQRSYVEVRFLPVLLTSILLTSARLPAHSNSTLPDPAAEFVELTADIEILSCGVDLGREAEPHSDSFQIHAIVGRDKWVMGEWTADQTNYYSFDGSNIFERWCSLGTNSSGNLWTRTSESPDGNPGRTIRASDRMSMRSRIAWLAFCSSFTLDTPNHRLYPPWDFWKQHINPSTLNERLTRFDDDLGLPKRLLLVSGEEQPVVDYRVAGTTNISGRLFPLSFYLLEYNPIGPKGWILGLLVHGKVSSIAPAADPLPNGAAAHSTHPGMVRFTSVPASQVHIEGTSEMRIEGTSNPLDWSFDTTNVVGFLGLNKGLLGAPTQQTSGAQAEDTQVHGEFFLPVRHLRGGGFTRMFSEKAVLHQALKSTDNPNIIFRLHHLVATNAPQPGTASLILQSTGEMVLGGIAKPVAIPIHVNQQGGFLKLSGSASINLSDFGIEPPSVPGNGWVVQIGNAVDSSFELRLKEVEPH
jgi:hypothetical protein